MKAVLMGTGYGQDLLDSPAGKSLPDTTPTTCSSTSHSQSSAQRRGSW